MAKFKSDKPFKKGVKRSDRIDRDHPVGKFKSRKFDSDEKKPFSKPFSREGGRFGAEPKRFGRDNDRSERSFDDFDKFKSERRFGRDGGARRGPLEMFDVTCAKCGRDCQVPFKPTNSKPVFCSDCFKKNAGNESNRFGDRSFGPKPFEPRAPRSFEREFISKPEPSEDVLDQINRKLDRIMKALKIN